MKLTADRTATSINRRVKLSFLSSNPTRRPVDGSNQKPDVIVTANFFRVVSAHRGDCKHQIRGKLAVSEQIYSGQGNAELSLPLGLLLAMLSLRFSALGCRSLSAGSRTAAGYTQGQSPEPRIREYFYYIDHQGQVNVNKVVKRGKQNKIKQNHRFVPAARDVDVCSAAVPR